MLLIIQIKLKKMLIVWNMLLLWQFRWNCRRNWWCEKCCCYDDWELNNVCFSCFLVMISSLLENSVLIFVVDNSDEIVEDIKWCLKCCWYKNWEWNNACFRSFSNNTCSAWRFGFEFVVDNSDEIAEDIDGV